MLDSHTFRFPVARPFAEVYDYLLEPTNYGKWSFVGDPNMRHVRGRDWWVETSVGPRIIRFPERNGFGLLDHGLMKFEGDTVHPAGLWAVPNGAGTELIYTNFRRPGMTDTEWSSTKDWIATDYLALQSMFESRGRLAPMADCVVVTAPVKRPVREIYDFLLRPERFLRWAFGPDAQATPVGDDEWSIDVERGRRIVRFGARNPYGIVSVHMRGGPEPRVLPLRVLPNGEGAEVIYACFRTPITDAAWDEEVARARACFAVLEESIGG